MKRKLDVHRELLGGTVGKGRDKQFYENTEHLIFDDSANKTLEGSIRHRDNTEKLLDQKGRITVPFW